MFFPRLVFTFLLVLHAHALRQSTSTEVQSGGETKILAQKNKTRVVGLFCFCAMSSSEQITKFAGDFGPVEKFCVDPQTKFNIRTVLAVLDCSQGCDGINGFEVKAASGPLAILANNQDMSFVMEPSPLFQTVKTRASVVQEFQILEDYVKIGVSLPNNAFGNSDVMQAMNRKKNLLWATNVKPFKEKFPVYGNLNYGNVGLVSYGAEFNEFEQLDTDVFCGRVHFR